MPASQRPGERLAAVDRILVLVVKLPGGTVDMDMTAGVLVLVALDCPGLGLPCEAGGFLAVECGMQRSVVPLELCRSVDSL